MIDGINFFFYSGIDGTGAGGVYRSGAGSAGDNLSDNINVSQMAYLDLVCQETGDVLSHNEFANSASSMRPIRIAFEPEHKEVCKLFTESAGKT